VANQTQPGLGGSYVKLWTSTALSYLADGILKTALGLVAIGYTRSPAAIAGLAFAITAPWLVFTLIAGGVADRMDRRVLMLAANALRVVALVALLATLLTHTDSLIGLYAVAICVGIADTVYDTAAQAMVPQLVATPELPRANQRLLAASLISNEFAGPPLAGLLVTMGASAALGTPAALWVLAIAALLLMRGRYRVTPDEADASGSLLHEIGAGLRFLWRHPLLRAFAAIAGVFNFASAASQAILVLYAVGSTSAMHLTKQQYGWLLSTVAIGSLLGALLAARLERRWGRTRTLALGITASALFIGGPALTTNPFLIGAAFLTGGAGLLVANVIMLSLRQEVTPPHLLGRINSGILFMAGGSKPLGALAGGVLAELLGLRAVFVIMGVLTIAMLAAVGAATRTALPAGSR
jgi:MFS family permease